MLQRTWTLVLSLGLTACVGTEPRLVAESDALPPLPAVAATTPPHDQRYAVAWIQTATEYEALTRMVFQAARARLEPIVTAARSDQLREWTAMPADEYQGSDAGQPPAVIFDLDETLLDNSAYQRRLIATNQPYDPVTWLAWSRESRARAIPGAVEFTRWLKDRGVRIYYISNRRAEERESTLANLKALGFPIDADGGNLLLRDDATGFGKDKVSRRKLVDREHRVIALFGDNLGDFLGGVFADNDTRKARLAPYQSWWGERWFMLPNAMYGSWVDAITTACRGDATPQDPRACMDSHGYVD